MGIKYLNRFFRNTIPSSMNFTSIAELSGKKIAVDISIYLYKYASDGNLIENIYLMLSIFRQYNVTPIFIFDGKAPVEKKELLIKRREDKQEAEKEFNNLKRILHSSPNIDYDEKQELINNMDLLKKKFVRISKNDIEQVKQLMRAYGATYYDAPGEADELCAMLTIKGKVWACLSEDMDMFVYGCPRVVRYLSLLNHTVVLYNMTEILDKLGFTQKELREICILSGTDYNTANNSNDDDSPNLYKTLKYFKRYQIEKQDTDFYTWLVQNNDYIKDYDLLKQIYGMFDLTNDDKIKTFENIKISDGPIIKNELKNILKTDGFIFPL
jgi:5'-3' exonuclease